MTANVAQAIVEPLEWTVTLRAIHAAVRPGGHLAFETRNPAVRAWESWNCAASHATVHVQDVGIVESWHDLMNVDGPLVTFRSTFIRTCQLSTMPTDRKSTRLNSSHLGIS